MQRWNVLLLVGLFCLAPMEVLASPIYVIENPDGSTTFTSRKPRTGRAKVFTAKDVGFSIYRSRTSMRGKLFQSRYRSIIGRVSSRHGIDSSLVRAIIHVESAFNPRARSPKGAMGLMQLMPSVIADSRVRNPYDPEENIRAGVAHFAKLLENLRGNRRLALAAYNAGLQAVRRFGGVPPYPETQAYVRKVLRLYNSYRSRA